MGSLTEYAAAHRSGQQCRVCALDPQVRTEIELGQESHIGPHTIAKWLKAHHDIDISPSAVGNHLNRHVKTTS